MTLLAHAGHWLTTVGFALAPLMVIGGVIAMALAERRRGARRVSGPYDPKSVDRLRFSRPP